MADPLIEMNRSIVEHYKGLKKTTFLLLFAYMGMMALFLSSFSEKANPTHYILLIFGITLMFSWIFYLGYAEHNRVENSLTTSGIRDFLISADFQISERNTGWNYEPSIYGIYRDCLIILCFSKQNGDIRNKFFIEMYGTGNSKDVKAMKSGREIETFTYPNQIRLTKDVKSGFEFKTQLDLFVDQLTMKK
ncbi:DUF6095 family protein [Fulvivirga ligni]|uniref:DUF6095 family protein n=1 Tax=Fulvivirga ligni TaxID=2904246 RepID=UPI001F4515EC|nr:DUF6095 family protein [Fulvivirga ligni]UII20532.1 DUF6095 family protein [Fulvivirga ligni]